MMLSQVEPTSNSTGIGVDLGNDSKELYLTKHQKVKPARISNLLDLHVAGDNLLHTD